MQCLLVYLLFISFNLFSFEYLGKSVTTGMYDMRYQADSKTKISFLQAEHKLVKNPFDEDGLSTLVALATQHGNPYIPAVRKLISFALTQGRFDEALELANVGHAYNDLPCMYSKATLLLNPDKVPSLSRYNPLSVERSGQELLMHAAQAVSVPAFESRYYYIPHALQDVQRLSKDYSERLWCAFEKSLDIIPAQIIEEIQKKSQQYALFNEGCYFIKKYIYGDTRFNNANNAIDAIHWAAQLLNSSDFNYEKFKESGAYEALEAVANSNEFYEHIYASFLLGYMDYARLSNGDIVDLEKLEKNLQVGAAHDPRALLMLASYTSEQTALLNYADQTVKRLDEIDPSLYFSVTHDLIELYHVLMQRDQKNIDYGLVRLMKHSAFKQIRDELCKDTNQAAKMGIKLMQMNDYISKHAKSKNRADHRKIHDAGLALISAAAQAGNEKAAWGLVDHSLNEAVPQGQKKALDDYVARAINITQSHIEAGASSLADIESFQQILKKLESAHLSSDNCDALAHWYLNGVSDIVVRNEVKAIEYIFKTQNAIKFLKGAFEESRINDPVACMQVGIFLHKNMTQASLYNLFFSKAILNGSAQVKKELADYCLQYKELIPVACSILSSLYYDLRVIGAPQAKKLREEIVEPISQELMQWAVGTHFGVTQKVENRHPAAIMFFNNPSILSLFDEEHRAQLEALAEWAAFNEDLQAVDSLEEKFKTCKKEIRDILKVTCYWSAWLKLNADKPEKSDTLKNARVLLKVISDWVLEPDEKNGIFIPHPRTHYQLANNFMETDPLLAVNHILIIEEWAKKHFEKMPQSAQIIEASDTYNLLHEKACRGIDWACYALACVELNRLEIYAEEHWQNHEQCFAQVDNIKKLLEKAKTFDTSMLDVRLRKENHADAGRTVLTLAEVEYRASCMVKLLTTMSGKPNPETIKRGYAELTAAVTKLHPEALYVWGTRVLNGLLDKGQKALEAAINLLGTSLILGIESSKDELIKIYEQGFAYRAVCGGNVTQEIRNEIANYLKTSGYSLPIDKIQDSSKDSNEYEHAIRYLNDIEKWPDALSTFKKLSDLGNIGARAYLGVMYRDGMAVPQSSQCAQELFVNALQHYDSTANDPQNLKALSVAYEALRESAPNNPEIRAQRIRYLLSRINEDNDFDKNIALVMQDVELLEKEMMKSENKEVRNLLFSSGLMKSLIAVCEKTSSIKTCLIIAKLCAQRCLKIMPTDMVNDQNAVSLTAPFAYLRDLMGQTVIGINNIKKSFANIDKSEIEEMINLIQKMISIGYLEPFGEMLGTLKVSLGIITSNKKLANEGISNWEQAEKNGDLRAGYMAALIKLRAERLAPQGFFVNAPSMGIAKLNMIAKQGHIPAYAFLGQWHLENGDVVAAMKYYKHMRIAVPGVITGAIGFLESISREYAKSSEEDRQLIKAAIEVTQSSNKDYMVRGALCASYLRIVKKYEGITDEQALDYIISSATSGSCKEIHAFEFLKETQFLKKFGAWLTAFENKRNVSSDSFMIKAYLAHALLLFTNSALSKSYDPYPLALLECDKALKLNSDLIDVEALKATIYYVIGTTDNDPAAIIKMKGLIMKCCKKLQEQHLMLDSVQLLDNLLKIIKMNGATPGSMINGNLIINIDNVKSNLQDRQWAEIIAKKFEAKPAKL